MKNLKLITIFASTCTIGLVASIDDQTLIRRDMTETTALQRSAMAGDITEFARQLSLGADPNKKWVEAVEGNEYNQLISHITNIQEFLEKSTKVSSAHTIRSDTAKKMLKILSVRNTLVPCLPFFNTWEKLTAKERLERISAPLSAEDRLPIDQIAIQMKKN